MIESLRVPFSKVRKPLFVAYIMLIAQLIFTRFAPYAIYTSRYYESAYGWYEVFSDAYASTLALLCCLRGYAHLPR